MTNDERLSMEKLRAEFRAGLDAHGLELRTEMATLRTELQPALTFYIQATGFIGGLKIIGMVVGIVAGLATVAIAMTAMGVRLG